MNIFLDYHSRIPIYEQIKEQIVLLISRGILKPDEQLPSLRQLSSQLSLNINTVKRALSELEAQGITYSVAGKGIFISPDATKKNAFIDDALAEVKKSVTTAMEMGADLESVTKIIKEIYKGEERND